jgi:hypothetical protein
LYFSFLFLHYRRCVPHRLLPFLGSIRILIFVLKAMLCEYRLLILAMIQNWSSLITNLNHHGLKLHNEQGFQSSWWRFKHWIIHHEIPKIINCQASSKSYV